MNEREDQERLRDAAKYLTETLREQNLNRSFRLKKTFNLGDADLDGWYVQLASWGSDRPALYLWLDKTLRREIRNFGISFSADRKKIGTLIKQLPKGLRPRKHLEGIRKNGEWFLKELPTAADVKHPLSETWESAKEFLYGRFDTGRRLNVRLAAEFVGAVVNSVTPKEQFAADIDEILNLKPTSRKTMIDARCGQGKYREMLLRRWDGSCAVTGCTTKGALRASHIKPWCECSEKEKLHPENGLLLVATVDALFDCGLISFRDDGHMLVSKSVSPEDQTRLKLPAHITKRLSPQQQKYLKFHRRSHGFAA